MINFSAFAETSGPVMVMEYDEAERINEVRELGGMEVAAEAGLFRTEEEDLVIAAELSDSERLFLIGEIL